MYCCPDCHEPTDLRPSTADEQRTDRTVRRTPGARAMNRGVTTCRGAGTDPAPATTAPTTPERVARPQRRTNPPTPARAVDIRSGRWAGGCISITAPTAGPTSASPTVRRAPGAGSDAIRSRARRKGDDGRKSPDSAGKRAGQRREGRRSGPTFSVDDASSLASETLCVR